MVSAFSLTYGISQLPAGWLTDRVGARIMITIGICGVAVAGFFVGLSLGYFVILVFMALMGLAGGGYHPAAPPIIAAAVEPKKRGRALGMHTIGGGASYFIAPIIAAAIASVWGWRAAFISLAIPATIFGILFYIVIGRISAKRDAAGVMSETSVPAEPGRWQRLVFVIVMSTFTQAVLSSIVAFVPLFMVDHFGVSKTVAASFLSVYYAAGLWVGPLGGYFSDRVGSVPLLVGVCLIAGPVVYLLSLVSHAVAFGALIFILGIITYVRMPVSESYIVGQTTLRNRSTVLGIYYFGTQEGAGILTAVIGYLVDHFGFRSVFTVSGASVLLVALLCSIWLCGKRN